MANPENEISLEKSRSFSDESGYSEKKTDLLIDRKMGKGLSLGSNIFFSKRGNKKKKR